MAAFRHRALVVAVWAIGLAVLAPEVQAQARLQGLTVNEVVAQALRDNPELAAARTEIDAAQGRLVQAGLRPNPMIDLGGQKALSSDNNVTVGLTVPLDLNGRKEGRVGVAGQELEVKRAQIADRERKLRAEVRMKAAELLGARRDVEVTDQLLRVNREGLALVGERVRRGAVPALEGSLLEVEVNRLAARRRLLASRVEVLTLQLKALAGLAPDAPLSVAGDLSASPPVTRSPEAAVARALEIRPDLAMTRAEAATAKARVAKERAEGRWDASINVGYQRPSTGFDLMGLTDRGGTRMIQGVFDYFGGSVSITVPVRNRNEGGVAAAEADTRGAARRVDAITLSVRQEVASAFAQHEALRQALDIYTHGVRDVAQRNLEVVRRTWELGRSPLLDVIAEQRRFIEVEMGYTEVLKAAYVAAVDVERAIGEPDR
jgi:cobalt-zinc-cadmium efflux system outer membrane protein